MRNSSGPHAGLFCQEEHPRDRSAHDAAPAYSWMGVMAAAVGDSHGRRHGHGPLCQPWQSGFQEDFGKNYVDKTNLIRRMNERVGGKESLLCISRPRRFGKSYAAMMLTAYYDCSCDTHDLFADKRIAESENYEEHINQYNVICLDVSGFISEAKRLQKSLEIGAGVDG